MIGYNGGIISIEGKKIKVGKYNCVNLKIAEYGVNYLEILVESKVARDCWIFGL